MRTLLEAFMGWLYRTRPIKGQDISSPPKTVLSGDKTSWSAALPGTKHVIIMN